MTANHIYHKNLSPELLKKQILFSSLINLGGASLYFAKNMPFSDALPVLAFFSSLMYAAYYLVLQFSESYLAPIARILSFTSFIVLSATVHLTGGIASPFIFLYFCILISETIYGLKTSLSLPLAVSSFVFVIAGEFFGLLPMTNPWTARIYQSPAVTLVILSTIVAFMGLTHYLADLLVAHLRASLEMEREENEVLLKKFSELNSSSQIGVLAHRIAHDLRGPISSISGYIQIEMLKDKTRDEQEMLKELNAVVTGMSESLNGITSFGKAALGRSEKILLPDFIRTLMAILSYSPQARGVKFVKRYEEKLPACVYAVRPDLQQAYFNIIKNAVEAVRDNADAKVIELDIRTEDKTVEVWVSDNGPGIVPEILATLFRKSLTTKKDGTGVGLVITRDLLIRNGGDIEMRNRPQGGLSVITRLPLVD